MQRLVLVLVVGWGCGSGPGAVGVPAEQIAAPATAPVATAPVAAPRLVAASLRPGPGTDAGTPRGDVVTVDAAGREVVRTQGGLATAPAIAADGQAVGWVELEWYAGSEGSEPGWSMASVVVVWGDAPPVRLAPTKVADVAWTFRDGGAKVAVVSAGRHGPSYFQLFDAHTGVELERADGCPPRPAWTDGLESRCD